MVVDTSTQSWMQPTKSGVGNANSTAGGSSSLVESGGDNTVVIVYVLLGVGAITPVVLLLVTAIVLRSRRAARRAVRRRATYNSAPTVDAVVDAWNSSVKQPVAGATDRRSNRSNASADGREETGVLSELAVREFFDVPDHHQASFQLYVSVEGPRSAKSGAASISTAASSTPGSGDWPSGSETSGEMERRADDLVALIGPASAASKDVPETAQNTRNQTYPSDDVPVPCDHSTSLTAPALVESVPEPCLRNGHNGSCPATVHTVVVDVEPPPLVNGLANRSDFEEDTNNEDEQPTLSSLSRMRRSEACYDIAHLSAPTSGNVPDDSSSKSSSPLPSPAPPTSAAGNGWNKTEVEPTEDLFSEEEKALKCLDAIANDYADTEEVPDPALERSKL